MNLGIGLGALVGGLIATTSDPRSFSVLFLLDAATFLVFAVILSTVKEPLPDEAEAARRTQAGRLSRGPARPELRRRSSA